MKGEFDFATKDIILSSDLRSKVQAQKDSYDVVSCNFSREDLNEFTASRTGDNYSVCTDKGTENGAQKDQIPANAELNDMKVSNFWKRVDMRQKKVIRGLCGLAKDYFKNKIPTKKTKDTMFQSWDDTLKHTFPELYDTSRLILLGHISVMCLSWKFPEKVQACTLFTEEEKKKIIEHGNEFREQRNNCSSTQVRKEMLTCPIVKIGKLLYSTSETCEESFWNQILERKKAGIIDFKLFKEAHLKDINKITPVGHAGDI